MQKQPKQNQKFKQASSVRKNYGVLNTGRIATLLSWLEQRIWLEYM